MIPTPTGLTITPGVGTLALAWGVNTTEGLSAFEAKWRPAGTQTWKTHSIAKTARTYTITGLSNSLTYEVQLHAKTAGGHETEEGLPLAKGAANTLGRPKYRVDTATAGWTALLEKAEKEAAWKAWVEQHVAIIRGYPTVPMSASSTGDRWVKLATGKPVTAYWDWQNNSEGEAGAVYYAPLTPAKRAKFVSERVAPLGPRGYAGPWIDDVNFSMSARSFEVNKRQNQTALEPEVGELGLLMEEIRAAAGAGAIIEGNSSFTIDWWTYLRPTSPAGTAAERESVRNAMLSLSIATLEHGVGANSNYTSATKYRELFEAIDWLHANGVQFAIVGELPVTQGEFEYHLATYLLGNEAAKNVPAGRPALGGDFINGTKQTPVSTGASNSVVAEGTWWAGWDIDLGAALGPRSRAVNGVWKREFANGLALTLEPGAAEQTVALPSARTWKTIAGATVTSVTLKPNGSFGSGTVLIAA